MEEKALITEVSGEERGEEGDEQGEGGEQLALRTSISSGSHALSFRASGPAQPCVPATNNRAGIKADSPHISCAQEP